MIDINDIIETLCDDDFKNQQFNVLKTFKVATEILEKHNIPYWLGYGTLIGCLRHGGFIPWDDDIDICILKSSFDDFVNIKDSSIKIIRSHDQLYRILSPNDWQIDVFILPENHIENLEMTIDEIFPLKLSEFNGIRCYIPNNPHSFFKRKYAGLDPLTDCLVWNHKINDMWSDGFEPKKYQIKFEELNKKWKRYRV